MGETRPVRLQLSRRKGFNLQALSMATNGLPAVNVARPGPWGNPFTVTEKMAPGTKVAGATGYVAVPTVEDAIECFRIRVTEIPDAFHPIADLTGKNLACWCKPGEPCHADVLLELACSPGDAP